MASPPSYTPACDCHTCFHLVKHFVRPSVNPINKEFSSPHPGTYPGALAMPLSWPESHFEVTRIHCFYRYHDCRANFNWHCYQGYSACGVHDHSCDSNCNIAVVIVHFKGVSSLSHQPNVHTYTLDLAIYLIMHTLTSSLSQPYFFKGVPICHNYFLVAESVKFMCHSYSAFDIIKSVPILT